MKTAVILLLTFILNINAYSETKDSLKMDQTCLLQEKITLQDSIIKSLEVKVHDLDIQKSFFSNEITIVTGLFATIVAIAIFLMGFIIPNINEKKYKSEIDNLKNEFKEIKENIEMSRKEINKTRLRQEMLHAKTMYFSCNDSNNTTGKFLWAIRYIDLSFDYYNENFKQEDYIVFATWFESDYALIKKEIANENKSNYVLYAEEINEISKKLTASIENSEFKKNIESMKVEFNKITWS